jgi:hypothetical protein
LLPQQFLAGQESLAGQAGSRDADVWAAGTLKFLVNCDWPQDGHDGFSLPRIKTSNSCPQLTQLYS